LSDKTSGVDIKNIEDYLCNAESRAALNIPRGANNIRIYKLSKLGIGVNDIYSFHIAFVRKGVNQKLDLVLKLYTDNKNRCLKEYKVIQALKRFNLPVPQVFIKETEEKIFGAPFLIMEKVKGEPLSDYVKHRNYKEILEIFGCFAKTLVRIHELKWKEIGLDFLKYPKNKWHYAKKQALWKDELPDYVDTTGFEFATKWLEINAQNFPCDRYSLIRNDMSLRNFLITPERKIVMLDWEWAEIGDALKDVGYAYHNIRHVFGARNIDKKGSKIALYFLRQYIKSSSKKIDLSALRFYLFSAGLREAVYLKHIKEQIKHPSSIKKTFGAKYLLLFPFIWWRYRSRYTHLQRFLKREALDYEQTMFGTPGGKILSATEIENILKFLDTNPSELILDIGTGSGRIARKIISKTGANVIGIDAGRLAIQSAKTKRKDCSEYYMIIADGQHLPFKNTCFDAIVCIRTLKYFPDYILGLSEMGRVLKSHGRLVVDLSSVLGYETILRYITHAISARGAHVFNFVKMKKLFRAKKLPIVDSTPLQKIPHKLWNLSANPQILRLLMVSEQVLRKITPSMLSRSILVKCIKD